MNLVRDKLKKIEFGLFYFTMVILFLRPEFLKIHAFGLKLSLTSVRNLLIMLSALYFITRMKHINYKLSIRIGNSSRMRGEDTGGLSPPLSP